MLQAQSNSRPVGVRSEGRLLGSGVRLSWPPVAEDGRDASRKDVVLELEKRPGVDEVAMATALDVELGVAITTALEIELGVKMTEALEVELGVETTRELGDELRVELRVELATELDVELGVEID